MPKKRKHIRVQDILGKDFGKKRRMPSTVERTPEMIDVSRPTPVAWEMTKEQAKAWMSTRKLPSAVQEPERVPLATIDFAQALAFGRQTGEVMMSLPPSDPRYLENLQIRPVHLAPGYLSEIRESLIVADIRGIFALHVRASRRTFIVHGTIEELRRKFGQTCDVVKQNIR